MKITKRCKIPSEYKWYGACRVCHSEAEATEAEMTNITHDFREGGYFSWEKCPVCGAGPNGGMLFYRIDR